MLNAVQDPAGNGGTNQPPTSPWVSLAVDDVNHHRDALRIQRIFQSVLAAKKCRCTASGTAVQTQDGLRSGRPSRTVRIVSEPNGFFQGRAISMAVETARPIISKVFMRPAPQLQLHRRRVWILWVTAAGGQNLGGFAFNQFVQDPGEAYGGNAAGMLPVGETDTQTTRTIIRWCSPRSPALVATFGSVSPAADNYPLLVFTDVLSAYAGGPFAMDYSLALYNECTFAPDRPTRSGPQHGATRNVFRK